MPRFYFDLNLQTGMIDDGYGHDYNTLKEAELSALRSAGELARDFLQKGTVGTVVINVRDESRQPVLRVTVSAKVEQVR